MANIITAIKALEQNTEELVEQVLPLVGNEHVCAPPLILHYNAYLGCFNKALIQKGKLVEVDNRPYTASSSSIKWWCLVVKLVYDERSIRKTAQLISYFKNRGCIFSVVCLLATRTAKDALETTTDKEITFLHVLEE